MEQEQEDTGILKELVIGIRKQLSERLVSPLMPSFTISWLIVNYKLVVAILSDESLESKLSFIDTVLYPTSQYVFVHGFLLPLAFALAYILAYPYPAKWVYKVALKRQHELREARQQAENARVLTLKESQRLRTYYYDREIALQKQIQGQQEGMEQLSAKIAELEKSQQQVEETPGLARKIPRQVLITTDLTEDKAKVLGALSYAENNAIEFTSENDLKNILKNEMTDLKIILEELEMAYLIQKSITPKGICYTFTYEGRKALKEYLSQQEKLQNLRSTNSISKNIIPTKEKDPSENTSSFPFKSILDAARVERYQKSRLLLTPEQLMDNQIKDFLQTETSFEDKKFLVIVKDGKVVVSLLPDNLSGEAKNFEYEFKTDNEINIWNEIDRIKTQIRRDMKLTGDGNPNIKSET